jgi:DNA-binding MarR family transcriptional regulator
MTTDKDDKDHISSIIDIDKVIHEPARLMIIAHLYVLESADFLFLKQQTGLTWGNLSSHISKLEDASYIKVEKEFVEKKPHTMIHLTENGRTAFREYQKRMKQVFEDSSK